jgi:hypothetical protein
MVLRWSDQAFEKELNLAPPESISYKVEKDPKSQENHLRSVRDPQRCLETTGILGLPGIGSL